MTGRPCTQGPSAAPGGRGPGLPRRNWSTRRSSGPRPRGGCGASRPGTPPGSRRPKSPEPNPAAPRAAHERRPRCGKGRGLHKKGGAGGKGVWGGPGVGYGDHEPDARDPSYDEVAQGDTVCATVVPELEEDELEQKVQPMVLENCEHGDTGEVVGPEALCQRGRRGPRAAVRAGRRLREHREHRTVPGAPGAAPGAIELCGQPGSASALSPPAGGSAGGRCSRDSAALRPPRRVARR